MTGDHNPVEYRPIGEDRHSTPADVCDTCSDFESGYLVPASFCTVARGKSAELEAWLQRWGPRPGVAAMAEPWLADIKTQILDPQLRELGLDPDRYELACEIESLPLEPPGPITGPLDIERMKLLRKIADGLGLPPELLDRPTTDWQQRAWEYRMDVPLDALAADPYGISSFESTRRRYMPRWRYVSGGKALHAFIDGSDRPACGVDPRRGPDRRSVRWIEVGTRGLLGYGQRRREHGPCSRAVREHQDAMRRGPS